ncbi:Rv3235 family protein [Humibacter ginsenosidimutans]|uniref:3-hydroxyacyl-CoA dehydrogenase n=1 Tax=Humibacter ginsenosidimutans TaxID=2599293 RepID=A0A5B8M9Y2_9MICO|nr:Rv3235 family protein [Humibacter ginsenosidimutans]QDZ16472.1 3-hydroxyacyl-CoA dehydrogenase [Humibacter ginsenosidimutans]
MSPASTASSSNAPRHGLPPSAHDDVPPSDGATARVAVRHGFGDEFFMAQRTQRAELPDPEPLLINLARSILEVIAGARDLEQLSRWVTDEVYNTLLHRTVLAERARRVKGIPAMRPALSVLSTHVYEPRDGIVEATVIVRTPIRVRALAIRLEGLDRRWRASALSVL